MARHAPEDLRSLPAHEWLQPSITEDSMFHDITITHAILFCILLELGRIRSKRRTA